LIKDILKSRQLNFNIINSIYEYLQIPQSEVNTFFPILLQNKQKELLIIQNPTRIIKDKLNSKVKLSDNFYTIIINTDEFLNEFFHLPSECQEFIMKLTTEPSNNDDIDLENKFDNDRSIEIEVPNRNETIYKLITIILNFK
jgi:hypothetical protein